MFLELDEKLLAYNWDNLYSTAEDLLKKEIPDAVIDRRVQAIDKDGSPLVSFEFTVKGNKKAINTSHPAIYMNYKYRNVDGSYTMRASVHFDVLGNPLKERKEMETRADILFQKLLSLYENGNLTSKILFSQEILPFLDGFCGKESISDASKAVLRLQTWVITHRKKGEWQNCEN